MQFCVNLSSNECQLKSFRRLVTVPGFHSIWFNIMAMLLSMWVPHSAGVFQTRTNKGEVGLTFNIIRTGIKILSDEAKGPVSVPYKA